MAYIGHGLAGVAAFENRQPVTAAKYINKSSLLILLPGVIRRLELEPISDPPWRMSIYSSPPYCQTASCVQLSRVSSFILL